MCKYQNLKQDCFVHLELEILDFEKADYYCHL